MTRSGEKHTLAKSKTVRTHGSRKRRWKMGKGKRRKKKKKNTHNERRKILTNDGKRIIRWRKPRSPKANWSSDRVDQLWRLDDLKNSWDNRVSRVEILGITREKVWLSEFGAAELIENWATAMAVVFFVVAVSRFFSLFSSSSSSSSSISFLNFLCCTLLLRWYYKGWGKKENNKFPFCSHEQFDHWLNGPNASLFGLRPTEIIWNSYFSWAVNRFSLHK